MDRVGRGIVISELTVIMRVVVVVSIFWCESTEFLSVALWVVVLELL